ncbi:hypothetical protein PRZ48_013587 [Zasmidium cellare]|uniref:Major facilitator superfamily (MFS) profile domain-containing protein n=1 Tax=Zasmidium cellare TaxID=395010 RepID=A0ABR0E1F9_ZASCE|nr:hypothetical protein PRZ48_013587 [Zasmidium cellare]
MPPPADPTKNGSSIEAADEATPLLLAPESGPTSNGPATSNAKPTDYDTIPHDAPQEAEEKPMPYIQILLLCYASLAEPVAYFAIFPFINEMIARTGGVPEDNVGFWSGLIESLFSLVQMVLMIFYGRMADRLGRKPVLVFSLAGVSVATALFGLSQRLWQMIMIRCLAGVFAGSAVTVRTMLSENTDKKTQGRAFSWYMFTRNLGIFVGPLVGGGLANPAEQFPDTFGHLQFFIDYPYALATFVAGAVCLTGTMSSLFFLKETLKRRENRSVNTEPPMTTSEVLKSPGVPFVLYLFGHTMLLALAYTAMVPVFLYTSVEKGGFGFSPKWISYFLAVAGGSQALWMLLVFPPLQRKIGTGSLMRLCAIVWPLMLASYPILNEFLRHGWNKAFWIVGPIAVVLGSGMSMAFACVQLFVNDISPSPTVLATVNALSLTVNSGVRAVCPALFTSIYAFGVKIRWADGHLAFLIIIVLALSLNISVYFIPEQAEGKPETKAKPSVDDEAVQ